MHEVDLRAVDLNLLKLLDALLKERSVTRAGVRLGLTQPAASRALGRLRTLLDDRVVVRTPKGLEFTPRAASLAHVCRTVCRRAERSIVALGRTETLNDAPRRYVNRLSDLLFVLARVLNRTDGGSDVLWERGRVR